jgi:hypothetical protein
MTLPILAYFISPHGYGHASRACAVMESIHAHAPGMRMEIFTRVPAWFFEASLSFPFGYHRLNTDIGLVQDSPLSEDLKATLHSLDQFIPFTPQRLAPAVTLLRDLGCSAAVCDISPYGIAAAHAAGLPAVLVENFTWDWIYAGFLKDEPGFSQFIPEFTRIFQSADAHIQTEPVCAYAQTASLLTQPVARAPRTSRDQVRSRLGIPSSARVVMVTMGGFRLETTFLQSLSDLQDVYFIVPGGSDTVEMRNNLVLLPFHSEYYHPDLINASDAVISKAGYSTIAEAYYANIPYGYVSRAQFRESPILSAFIQEHMGGLAIDGASFTTGAWTRVVSSLLEIAPIPRSPVHGANQVAEYLLANYLQAGSVKNSRK